MLYVYDKRKKALTPCKDTELCSHGLLERQDLSKWIEQFPEMLGEELLVITSEYDRFDKTNERLDLLAIDKVGSLVVIELKRDDSGKSVDLQAIKYAAYCSTLTLEDLAEMYTRFQKQKGFGVLAENSRQVILDFIDSDEFEELNDRPRIILAAGEFRPEVTASVLWLRKFGLDITCVRLDPYELPDGGVALNSSVLIPLPEAKDFIIQAEKKEHAEHTKTVTQMEYIEFYSKCIELLRCRVPQDYPAPSGRSIYQIPTGISSVHYEWAFHGRPRSSFGVELHVEKGSKERSEALITRVAEAKSRLESVLDEHVTVQKDWGKTWARLYVEKQQGTMTDELRQWAVDKMATLIRVLQPELDMIKEG